MHLHFGWPHYVVYSCTPKSFQGQFPRNFVCHSEQEKVVVNETEATSKTPTIEIRAKRVERSNTENGSLPKIELWSNLKEPPRSFRISVRLIKGRQRNHETWNIVPPRTSRWTAWNNFEPTKTHGSLPGRAFLSELRMWKKRHATAQKEAEHTDILECTYVRTRNEPSHLGSGRPSSGVRHLKRAEIVKQSEFSNWKWLNTLQSSN